MALIVGWTGALRRSGLAAVNWTDLGSDDVTGKIRLIVCRQKNGPAGTEHVLRLIPRNARGVKNGPSQRG